MSSKLLTASSYLILNPSQNTGPAVIPAAAAPKLKVIIHQNSASKLPCGLIVQPVPQHQRNQLGSDHPYPWLEAGIQMGPFGPESCFPHWHVTLECSSPARHP